MSTHKCPGGCGADVPSERLACRSHWYRLPVVLRAAIRETYRGSNLVAHRAAIADALDWYRHNRTEVTP